MNATVPRLQPSLQKTNVEADQDDEDDDVEGGRKKDHAYHLKNGEREHENL